MRKSILLILLLPVFMAVSALAQQGATVPPTLSRLQSRLEIAIDSLDKDTARISAALGASGFLGEDTDRYLKKLCKGYPSVVDCTAVDPKGIMKLVEPAQYKKYEGSDISGQDQVKRVIQTKKPVLSMVFKSVEGIDAVDLEHPVLGPDGQYLGSLSVMFKPEKMLADAFEGVAAAGGFEAWVLQTDGRILFATLPGHTGMNLLSDPRYKTSPSFVALGKNVAAEAAGSGPFEFSEKGQSPVKMMGYWTTVDLHGNAWRILVTQPVQAKPPTPSASSKLLDMTFPFGEDTIYWPTAEPFQLTKVFWGKTDGGYWYATNDYGASEHGGTHADAPVHFGEGGRTVDQVPLEEWVGPAAKIDVSAECAKDRDYMLRVEDIMGWERAHGRLPAHAWVVMVSGLDGKWYPDRKAVLGTELKGKEAVALLTFPGFSPEAAAFLVKERDIAGVAVDTPSIDRGRSTDFLVHRIVLGAGKLGLENLANVQGLPEAGALLYVIPMLIRQGTGAPARVFAMMP